MLKTLVDDVLVKGVGVEVRRRVEEVDRLKTASKKAEENYKKLEKSVRVEEYDPLEEGKAILKKNLMEDKEKKVREKERDKLKKKKEERKRVKEEKEGNWGSPKKVSFSKSRGPPRQTNPIRCSHSTNNISPPPLPLTIYPPHSPPSPSSCPPVRRVALRMRRRKNVPPKTSRTRTPSLLLRKKRNVTH